MLALGVLAATLPSVSERRSHKIDYGGTLLLAIGLSAIILLTTLGGNTFDWGSPQIVAWASSASSASSRSLRRAARGRADPAAVAVQEPRLRGHERRRAGRRLRALRCADVPAAVPADRARALADGVRPAAAAGDGRTAVLLDRLGAGDLAHRALQGVPDRRHRGRRLGLYLLSSLDEDTSEGVAAFHMLVLGLGLGMVMQVLVLAVQNAMPYDMLGVATSGSTLFRSIGGSLGTAVLGAIFSGRWPPSSRPATARTRPSPTRCTRSSSSPRR